MTFGEKVRVLRVERNLTLDALGELLGVAQNTISRWENGKSMPGEMSRRKIASAFGISLTSLMDGVASKSKARARLKLPPPGFGEVITKLRVERGMTAIAFAELLGVSNNTIYRWECGKNTPSGATCEKIAAVLGIPIDDLIHTVKTEVFSTESAGNQANAPKPLSFGESMKSYRKEQHLSAAAFGKMIGVSVNSISRWENDKCLPRNAIRQKIVAAIEMAANVPAAAAEPGYVPEKADDMSTTTEQATFGEIIKELRSERELSATAFGKLIGVSGKSIYVWESEKSIPRKATRVKIAETFGISESKLMDAADIRRSSQKKASKGKKRGKRTRKTNQRKALMDRIFTLSDSAQKKLTDYLKYLEYQTKKR
jgi:transcriptional regulator with XRE-family HTH domain